MLGTLIARLSTRGATPVSNGVPFLVMRTIWHRDHDGSEHLRLNHEVHAQRTTG
jgi:hypothetical protein